MRPTRSCFLVLLLALCSSAARPDSSAPESAAQLQSIVDRHVRAAMEQSGTPGVVISVVRGDSVVLESGYGFADMERQIEADPRRTLMRIGSITKLFTHTAAMQLVEQGRMELDADINDYLQGARIRDNFPQPVTANHLMAHRAGFEDAVMYELLRPDGAMPSPVEFVRDHQPARVRPPGLATSYSNFGVSTLGFAVASISGMPYPQYVQRHIFDPLGMHSSTLLEPPVQGRTQRYGSMPAALVERAAVGYRRVDGKQQPVPYEHIYPAAAPAGSAFSTAADMALFMRAYLRPDGETSLIRPETRALMWQRAFTDRNGATDYAHGFVHGQIAGHESFAHGGTLNGFRALLVLVPAADVGIFIAGNSSQWRAGPDIARAVVEDGFGMHATTAAPKPAVTSGTLSEFAGTYMTSRRSYTHLEKMLALSGAVVKISAEPGYLSAHSARGTERWTQIEPLRFRNEQDRSQTLVFQRDENGRVVRFYPPAGNLFFERLHWWQTPSFVYVAIGASGAVGAILLLVLALRRRAISRWISGITVASSAIAVATALFFWRARPLWENDAATVLDWPPTPLRHLIIAGCLLVASVPFLIAGLIACGRHARREAWQPFNVTWTAMLAALCISSAAAAFALYEWRLFGPAFY